MKLRERQVAFCERCSDALAKRGNTLGVAPTGAGKTVMLSRIMGDIEGPKMVLQHRDELVQQNSDTFRLMNPRLSVGEFTSWKKEWGRDTTFAMIQTLSRQDHLDKMPPLEAMAVDEAHHCSADTYRRVIDAAKKRNPGLLLLGVTATPNRGDKKALRPVFDNCADQITLKELIDARHLVPPRTFVIDLGVQDALRGVKRTVADFDMDAVAAIMDHKVLNDRVAEEWRKVAADRPTVVFCANLEHAEHVTEAFERIGAPVGNIRGDMGSDERKRVLAAYDRGELRVLVNVAVLVEGFDHQPTSCIILLRPSSYKSTMIQMIGRGLRKVDPERYPGVVKSDCIVMDFGTSILTHGGIEQDVDLDQEGTKACPECLAMVPAQAHECPICGYDFPRQPPEMKDCPECGATNYISARNCIECGYAFTNPEEKGELGSFILTEVDLLADSPYRWTDLFDGIATIATAMDAWSVVIHYNGRWHAVCGGKAVGVLHKADTPERLQALATADDFLREYGDTDAAGKARRWLHMPPTDNQVQWLQKQGWISDRAQAIGMTRYEAACYLEWLFQQRAIRAKLERTRSLAAA